MRIKKATATFKRELRSRAGLSYAFAYTSIPGNLTIEARKETMGTPVGTIWYSLVGSATIDITGMYVMSFARRCGVASWLLDNLIRSYPHVRKIITAGVTQESGPLMRKQGFRKNKITNDYEKLL